MLNMEEIERLRAVANARGPLLIATDLDGTLAPIVEYAADARVPDVSLAVLDRLATRAKVAVITGRDLNTARRLVPVEGVIVIGSHGLEPSFEHPLLPPVDRERLAAALEQVEQSVISAVPSSFLHIERKAISTAFHFRTSPELEPALRKILARLPDGLRLREGRMVLEVVPNTESGKGLAMTAVARHLRARAIISMGDDATDAAMFRAAATFREEGAHVLLVGISGGEETPPEIAELSDMLLRNTEEGLEALEIIARALGV
jgi:trehalose 6-phosphate phosphatase